jgi:hypothetical protein
MKAVKSDRTETAVKSGEMVEVQATVVDEGFDAV